MRGTRSLSAPAASVGMALAVAALAAGCGGATGGGSGDAGATASASTSHVNTTPGTGGASASPSASAPHTPGPTVSTSKPPLTTGRTASLTGTAVRGAEPGCVGLKTADGHSYELAGDAPRKLARGGGGYESKLGKVKVTGHFASAGLASHCMMGRIFVVSKLKKLG